MKTSFFRRQLHLLKHEYSKPILITISAALSIGVIFGFLMLQMVHQDEEETTYHVYATSEGSEDEEEQTTINLPGLQLFVHQGGVFSNKENAEQYSKQLTKKNIPFVIKEEDGQYFVWMNVHQTETAAKKHIVEMDKQGMEVYVKEWTIPASTISVTEQAAIWLESFAPVIQTGLEDGAVSQEKVEKLVTMEGMTKQVQAWQSSLEAGITTSSSEEQLLLALVHQYEQSLKDIKE